MHHSLIALQPISLGIRFQPANEKRIQFNSILDELFYSVPNKNSKSPSVRFYRTA